MATVETLMKGYPIRTTRGSVSYCSQVLITADEGSRILVDCGFYNDRDVLHSVLKERGMSFDSIDVLILSHLHFDHCVNARYFKKSRVLVQKTEVEYAKNPAPHDWYIHDYYEQMLNEVKSELVDGEVQLTSDVRLIPTPGHTPGHMATVATTPKGRYVLACDAAKSVKELTTKGCVLRAMPQEVCRRSIERLLSMADYIIPGHDRELKVVDGHVCLEDVDNTLDLTLQFY